MGTLTAGVPRLTEHCPHKLATSCRLTSTPNCCACADERPHSQTYSVYIDGVGFVQRGTRWQSYCWFCKEFWANRLLCTSPPLQASQTRIPEIPDQSEFLDKWFEFHQGYRIVKRQDGSEYHVAVLGEPFREVSPGFLPRTLDQLRGGIPNDASRPQNRFGRARLESEEEADTAPQQSLEDALDSLLEEVSDDEPNSRSNNQNTQPSNMPRRRSNTQNRRLSQRHNWSRRAADRIARVFGTREEVQQDDYQSPLATMYNRAWDRYRQAEAARALNLPEDDRVASDTPSTSRPTQELSPQELSMLIHALDSIDSSSDSTSFDNTRPSDQIADEASSRSMRMLEAEYDRLDPALTTILREVVDPVQQRAEIERLIESSQIFGPIRHAMRERAGVTISAGNLDAPDRPEPKSDEEMTFNLACQVCYCQVADIAMIPCGHMVMCEYCADVVVPVKNGHYPSRPSKCPLCRKKVQQRYKIHMTGAKKAASATLKISGKEKEIQTEKEREKEKVLDVMEQRIDIETGDVQS